MSKKDFFIKYKMGVKWLNDSKIKTLKLKNVQICRLKANLFIQRHNY